MSDMSHAHACPCCGYRTLSAPSRGSWLTCPVCAWTDEGGDDPASIERLFVAQRTYQRTGVSAPERAEAVLARSTLRTSPGYFDQNGVHALGWAVQIAGVAEQLATFRSASGTRDESPLVQASVRAP